MRSNFSLLFTKGYALITAVYEFFLDFLDGDFTASGLENTSSKSYWQTHFFLVPNYCRASLKAWGSTDGSTFSKAA